MIQQLPPDLYRDEAYTGIDALRTLREGPKLFYPIAFGREPLFTWLVAGSIKLWGATPFAVRFPAVLAGSFTLVALYLATKELWGQRIAVLATAVLAVLVWHIVLSRIGFRAILVPLFNALAVWQIAKGIKRGPSGPLLPWITGGAMAGLLLYTYPAARAAALPAGLMALYSWRRRGKIEFPTWRALIAAGAAALIVMMPFLWYTARNPDEVLMRTANVGSIFNSKTPWLMAWDNATGVLGMTLLRGDHQTRHNVPNRPVFDPALGIFFLIGIGVMIRQFPDDPRAAFLVFWTVSMLLPTLLAAHAPHFLRAIGVLPFLTVVPALGADRLWKSLRSQSPIAANLVVMIGLLAGLASTTYAYFIRYPDTPDICYRFECAGVELASEVNAYLGQGWTRGAWFAHKQQPVHNNQRQVFVQYQLWKDVVNAHYLIPDSPGFNVPGDPAIDSHTPYPDRPTLYYGWHNRHYPDYWKEDMRAWLPPASRIELTEGPLAITAQDKDPHVAYLRFASVPATVPPVRLADMEHGLSLISSCTSLEDDELTVTLVWYAAEIPPADFTVFLHYERDGAIIAQADGEPGMGYYPMTAWRAGDQFVDHRRLPVETIAAGDRAYAGLYFYPTGDRVQVLASTQAVEQNRIQLDLHRCTSQ